MLDRQKMQSKSTPAGETCYIFPLPVSMLASFESEMPTKPYGSCGHLAPPARLELTTLRLGGVRSIQVSYGGMMLRRVLYLKKERLSIKPGRIFCGRTRNMQIYIDNMKFR